MTIVLWICLSILGYCLFGLFRNQWVYELKMRHNKTVFLFAMSKAIQDEYNFDSGRAYDCLWNYERMVLSFWVWDIRKMVKDHEIFDMIYGDGKTCS